MAVSEGCLLDRGPAEEAPGCVEPRRILAEEEHEERLSASAGVTGASYVFSVVPLALPYFLAGSMTPAFAAGLGLALLLAAGFTLYSSVVQAKGFARGFAESAALMLGTAAGGLLFGYLVGSL